MIFHTDSINDSPEETPPSKPQVSVRQIPEDMWKGGGIVMNGNCGKEQGAHEERIGIFERGPGQSSQKKR